MELDINVKSTCKVDIDTLEAFSILCRILYMDFVLDEDTYFFIKRDEDGEQKVYTIENGQDELYDDRGKLFIALRNVAAILIPNILFRNAEYIMNEYQED